MATSVKEQARELMDRLPPDVDWDAVLDAVEVRRKIARGLADIEAGRVVPHAEAMRRLGISD